MKQKPNNRQATQINKFIKKGGVAMVYVFSIVNVTSFLKWLLRHAV